MQRGVVAFLAVLCLGPCARSQPTVQVMPAVTIPALPTPADTIEFSVRVVVAGIASPTGRMRFLVDGAELGVIPLVNGTARITGTQMAPGQHHVTAEYLWPATDLIVGISTLEFKVGRLTTTAWIRQNVENQYGQPLLLEATVDPPDSGTLTYFDGDKELGTVAVVEGRAQVPFGLLGVGRHSVVARYLGGPTSHPSTSSALPVVIRTTASVTLSATPAVVMPDGSVSLTVIVPTPSADSVAPSGTAALFTPQESLGTITLANGAGVLTIPASRLGAARSIRATYSGDAYYSGAESNTVEVDVRRRSTVTSLDVSLSDRVTLRATVSSAAVSGISLPVNAGTVRFSSSSQTATATVVQGVATLQGALDLWLGQMVTARFEGDALLEPSDSGGRPVLAPVNGFSFRYDRLAPSEVVALFFPGFGDGAAAPVAQVTGSDQVARAAHIYFTSDTQATVALPDNVPLGPARLSYTRGAGFTAEAGIEIVRTAPGLATASADGQGSPAAQVLRVQGTGTLVEEFGTLEFRGDTLYLILFGTGFRHATTPVTCVAAGRTMTATFAGAQGQFPGLDQINLPLDASLAGAGTVTLSCLADGRASNAVTLRFP